MNRIKYIIAIVMMMCMSLFASGCSDANSSDESVDESQQSLCSAAPLVTVNGYKAVKFAYLKNIIPFPGELYSATVNSSAGGGFDYKISWGSTSAVVYRTTGCNFFEGGACQPWPTGKTFTVDFLNRFGTYGTSMLINGVKVAEIDHVHAVIATHAEFDGGLTRVSATGVDSKLRFTGINGGATVSQNITFKNGCGFIQ